MIGSTSNIKFKENLVPRLMIHCLKIAVGKAQYALLIISYFFDKWAVNSDLNLTVIMTAGQTRKSLL
jgi:hypothetical protein